MKDFSEASLPHANRGGHDGKMPELGTFLNSSL